MADAGGAPRAQLVRIEALVQRPQALGGHRIADMRVVKHDQVVAFGQFIDGAGLEAFERLSLPGDVDLAARARL